MVTIIIGGKVILPDFSGFCEKDLWIEDGKIVAPCQQADRIIDAQGRYILPGLIDIHNHGSNGDSYSYDTNYDNIRKYCASQGITGVLATSETYPKETMLKIIRKMARLAKESCTGATIWGIHLEGPFISSGKSGAMPGSSDDASTVALFEEFVAAGDGLVKVMTLAPERENALDIIRRGAEMGIRMSFAHTLATYEETMTGIAVGATGATHTFNAMPPLVHRAPGVLGAVLTEPTVTCEAICDFVHLAPATVKLIYAAKGVDGMIMVSDAGPQTGLPDGDYLFGTTLYVTVKTTDNKRLCTVTGKDTIAGSMYNLADGARNMVKLGIPMNQVSKMASYNPAKAARIDHIVGNLDIGKQADLIFVDEAFNVKRIFINGNEFIGKG